MTLLWDKTKESLILLAYLILFIILLSYLLSFGSDNQGQTSIFKNYVFVLGSITVFVTSLFCLKLLDSYYLYNNIVNGLGISIAILFMLFFVKGETENQSIKKMFGFLKKQGDQYMSKTDSTNLRNKLNSIKTLTETTNQSPDKSVGGNIIKKLFKK
tara:strand:- start:8 stop:478 length:471 start_codon:yes stop_codon:yes gene_type:complete